jgi:hypothetical protein
MVSLTSTPKANPRDNKKEPFEGIESLHRLGSKLERNRGRAEFPSINF